MTGETKKKTSTRKAGSAAPRRRRREILAQATVHMPNLGFGQRAYVDPENPHIAELLEAGLLVPVADRPSAR